VGRKLTRLVKPPADRLLHFDFGDGWGLVVELAPQRANLIALGEKGIIAALWRQPRGARAGVTPGQPWSVGGLPPGRLDPFHADAAAIDAALSAGALEGESGTEAIKRRLVGVGATGAALIALGAGICVELSRWWSSALLAMVIFLSMAMVHLPVVLKSTRFESDWTKTFVLSGGAILLAGLARENRRSNALV
jgi:hypothetical protein